MKFYHFIILSIVILSCGTNKKISFFIPPEYTLSPNDKMKGKTLVYFDSAAQEYSYRDIYCQKQNGKEVTVTKSYTKEEVSDSIIELKGRLYESYSYIFSRKDPVKAEILLDTVTDNGKKLGRQQLNVRFTNDSMKLTILSKSEYLKDTVFTWNNSALSTVVVKSQYTGIINKKPENDELPDFILDFTTYYAKGIGEIRITVFNIKEQRFKNIDLVKIRDKAN